MPEVIVYAVEGRSIEQHRGLVKDITDAVTRNFGVTAEQVVVQIVESAPSRKARGGILFSDR
ncbi:4-oxalocrotonate tautomerase [Kaistia soli DSM 19436]|uniref:4-oxalocrotonate tautomerase n=1 Tax=Kaistia soli DSM 19436 TaxID=1122133 RepID=A0A1M5I0F6_9HYPH|nr:tautomerase family protein [Kaistia soli]SHG21493.1 4-oxalocrotonate tautomerase [Kaistia soli DSM 19436]